MLKVAVCYSAFLAKFPSLTFTSYAELNVQREAVGLHVKGHSTWSHEARELMEVLTLSFFMQPFHHTIIGEVLKPVEMKWLTVFLARRFFRLNMCVCLSIYLCVYICICLVVLKCFSG